MCKNPLRKVRRMRHAGLGTWLALLLGISISNLQAGTTGKIAGLVSDIETGEPLIGCNVVVESSGYLGAATNIDGSYTITGVPPGKYSVIASMIGYKSTRVSDVLVSVDLTTEVNIEMVSEILESGEVVTVTAERPMVEKDLTSSAKHVSADQIKAMPVETFNEVLDMQAGMVAGHVRGGRSGETLYMVDGIPVTDPYNGNMAVDIENTSIQELQFITGAFNAEYGQAMSGVVNIVTKDGSDKWSYNLSGYMGDHVSTHTGIFRNIDDLKPTAQRNLQASLSGPIIRDKFSFFTTARYFAVDGHLQGVRQFEIDDTFYSTIDPRSGLGVDGRWWVKGLNLNTGEIGYAPLELDSLRTFKNSGYRLGTGDSAYVSMNPYSKTSFHTKFTYRVTPTLSVNFNILRDNSWQQNWDEFFQLNPDGLQDRYKTGGSYTVGVNHQLSQSSFYSLGYSRVEYEWLEYKYKNPEDTKKYADLDGDGTLDLINVLGTQQLYSFITGGIQNSWFNRRTISQVIKGDYTNQLTQVAELKTGVQARLNNIYRRLVGFDVQTGDTIGYILQVEPQELSAYAQTKLEFSSLILNAGLRYDYFNSNFHVPTDMRDPDIYSPIRPDHRYRDKDGDGHIDDPEPFVDDNENGFRDAGESYSDLDGDGKYDSSEKIPDNEFTFEEREAFWYRDAKPKAQFSPRIGIGYPISDQGVIHISYGHFFQIPNYEDMFNNPEYRLASGTGINSLVGNADLEPQKTVSYEIGLQQQLTDDIGIDLSVYYRDIRQLVSANKVWETYDKRKYVQYINLDYANARGVTLALEKRHSDMWSANIDYTFQIAEGNTSDPQAAFRALQGGSEPEVHFLRLDWDQRHSLNFTTTVGELANWGVSLSGQLGSGLPYTPSDEQGNLGTAIPNSGTKPGTILLDMKYYHNFTLMGQNFSFYVKADNLLDILNEYGVYGDTGTAEYTLAQDRAVDNNAIEAINSLDTYFTHPTWYGEPRRVTIGFSLGSN
ncbi:MAG: TonB-dependent receptor [Lentisphaeria bacterium]|nr:TonB-dependent receptor [Candidatus Neomarinimicrobiota bacterium]MCF7842385.1 TonB-dependent receptor [Lentisphaeria bacterium]